MREADKNLKPSSFGVWDDKSWKDLNTMAERLKVRAVGFQTLVQGDDLLEPDRAAQLLEEMLVDIETALTIARWSS